MTTGRLLEVVLSILKTEGLLLLITEANADIQKIVAFESAFERRFSNALLASRIGGYLRINPQLVYYTTGSYDNKNTKYLLNERFRFRRFCRLEITFCPENVLKPSQLISLSF